MAIRWHVECIICDKKESFVDTHDIAQSKWQVLGWKVPSSEPICICDECEYGKPKKEKKK